MNEVEDAGTGTGNCALTIQAAKSALSLPLAPGRRVNGHFVQGFAE